MNRFFLGFCLFLSIFVSSVHGAQNAVFVIIDGVSRSTLYPLLAKDKMEHLNGIIEGGNYRNLSITGPDGRLAAYKRLFVGSDLESVDTVFSRLSKGDTKVSTGVLWSVLEGEDFEVDKGVVGDLSKDATHVYPIQVRTDLEIERAFKKLVQELEPPFLIVINYNSPAKEGFMYREGSERYSLAVQRVDRALGRMKVFLERKKLWKSTDMVVTTSFCFFPNSNVTEGCDVSWIAGSQKSLRLGDQYDVVPTLLDVFGLHTKERRDGLKGWSLFQ